ncbi:hypothetical protein [Catellatospora tritici]|uniref:hypothetical protein n=1 Tax=Catellatospora tritici TaxID=2851566 RepID=UPI001C2D1B38|nr:hypothetical protein [Catellatospora tritici]MBV1849837.1 hypothetical protein [Catellatospora tritici]
MTVTMTTEDLRQEWLVWAQNHHLGSRVQNLAAASAAMEAASRGATSQEAAEAARKAAACLAAADSEPELSAGGITWQMAMQHAAYILGSLPLAFDKNNKMTPTWASNMVSPGAAAAQAWISFARELTMHGDQR